MKFGVRLPVSGPIASADSIVQTALAAERWGFDFLTVHDHIERGFNERYHFAVGTVEAVDSSPRVTNFFESITTFCYLAGMTKRIRFIPAALVLPVRNVPTVVKQFQTAQELSGGRFVFCVAVGNSEKDFEVTGTSWENRGKKLDEGLKLATKMFNSNGQPISFEGEFSSFLEAEFSPSVALPIWIAGKGPAALRRVAEFATGWMPSGITPEAVEETRGQLEKVLSRYNRKLSEIDICIEIFVGVAKTSEEAQRKFGATFRKFSNLPDITRLGSYSKVPIGSPEDIVEWVDRYKKAGVNHFEAKFYASSTNELLDAMELFGRNVMPGRG
jgi:alkanesulfonate monooxygenase SsuD/methylene tetrahydromethanopterin reductase-like flavin-dependent oxidoreductase (luciferase family)